MSTCRDLKTVMDLCALAHEIDAFVTEGGLRHDEKEKIKGFAARIRAIAEEAGREPLVWSMSTK
jgi:hypothetical protein